MKKKIILIVLTMSLAFALSGCKDKSVDLVSQKITEIGTVTLNSQAQLDEISVLYGELSDKQKAKVENYSEFETAKTTYENLKAEEEARQKAIEAGNIYQEGYLYLIGGNDYEKDTAKALELFEEAAALDSLQASLMAGFLYDTWVDYLDDSEVLEKASGYFEKCLEDNQMANICLGILYRDKRHGEQDTATSQSYFDKVASLIESDNYTISPEQYFVYGYYLGRFYGLDDTGYENNAKSLDWYEKSVEALNTESMYYYGYSCLMNDTESDNAKALEYLETAGGLGNENAMNYLGGVYCFGMGGVEKDPTLGLEWFKKAADSGSAVAMRNIGSIYYDCSDYEQALEWYEKGGENGDAHSYSLIGCMYGKGELGEVDYVKANEYYQKAADCGDSEGMLNLAISYRNGYGVEADIVKSAEWYEKAANAGHPDAMYFLADMYLRGEGVEQDFYKSAEWFEKAANAGDVDSMYLIGIDYYYGLGVTEDHAKAAEWFEKGAYAGDPDSMYNLGVLYYNGDGVEKNVDLGLSWIYNAYENGYKDPN